MRRKSFAGQFLDLRVGKRSSVESQFAELAAEIVVSAKPNFQWRLDRQIKVRGQELIGRSDKLAIQKQAQLAPLPARCNMMPTCRKRMVVSNIDACCIR